MGLSRCKHNWEVSVVKVMPAVMNIKDFLGGASAKNIDWNLFKRTQIIILTCKKCGKLDKTITSSGSSDETQNS